MLGLVLAAFALSGVMPAASAETIPTDEITCSDGQAPMLSPSGAQICVFEESMMKLQLRGFELVGGLPPGAYVTATVGSGHGAPLPGPLPEVRMSNLPEIGETAVVTVTYTNDHLINVTETDAQSSKAYSTGIFASPGFKIVDNGGLTFEPFYPSGNDEIEYYEHFVPTALDSGESITYTIEVRAVTEGLNSVGGIGYHQVDEHIFIYLDEDETLHWADHRDLYPEQYQRHVMSPLEREQAEEARWLAMLADAIENPPSPKSRLLVGDELIEVHTKWVVEEKIPLGEAVDELSGFALDTDDIRRILIGAGFSEDEINNVLPADDVP